MNPIEWFLDFYHEYIPPFTNDILWGQHTFIILLAVGLLFTVWSKFIQFRALTHGVSVVRGKYDDKRDPGAINHFQALSAALSATVGLGNIGGVAVAVAVGGPGAVFWMWVVGFLGMAIKSVEVTLAMIYRDTSDPDNPHGGAMWVIKRGFGDKVGGIAKPFAWIVGAIFCVTLLISTMTGGNMFQVWNVSQITNEYFGIDTRVTGIVLASLTALVIIGGIKRIGAVAGKIVPLMCGLYIVGGIVVLFVKAANVPDLLLYIVKDAFNPHEATGAFLGASAWYGLTTGLRRALFSNEAGQGSSPIAHSAAKTDEPVREGVVAGLEPFIDTCLVCTLTALVILSTGAWNRQKVGDFNGEIEIVQATNDAGEAVGRVSAPTNFETLPALPPPAGWYKGNRFFLLAEVPNADENTASTRVQVGGRLVEGAEDANEDGVNDLVIQWDEVPKDAVLVDTGVYQDLVGAPLTGHAFDRAIPGLGRYLVTAVCWLFAFSTMISWSYYGEQGVVFLFGKALAPLMVFIYKLIFCALAIVASWPGFIETNEQLGLLADLGTGVMLLANVPIIVLMGYQSMRAFNDYFGRMARGEMEPPHEAPPIAKVIEGEDVE